MQGLSDFVSLVELAGKDIVLAKQELINRLDSNAPSDTVNSENRYATELRSIQTCKEVIEEVKKNAD